MKGVLLCLALVMWVSAACALAAAAQWPALAAHLAVGATCAAVWGYVRARRVERRMAALSAILAEHYRMGYDKVTISMLTGVLQSAEVDAARRDWLHARELEWAQRYANGEASDY